MLSIAHSSRRVHRALAVSVCALAAVTVAGCGGSSHSKTKVSAKALSTNGLGQIALTSQQQHGRALFKSTCASCHTLEAAGAKGDVGPNLDLMRPPAAAVIATIESGLGAMPAHLLKGADAHAVASFIEAVTAH